jgi:POT family proton-dependent oligopeptide transporter
MDEAMGDSPAPKARHPIGLYVLFVTEMWERFGFYCMEAVFVYYMEASRYPVLRANASQIYGLYLAGVYFTPFFGGLLSEWRLGYALSILLGGLFLAGGYGLLSLEPEICFGLGLAGIIVGNGLFKPNISSLVGKLYPAGDARIDSAFTIFYMGINVGALIAPIMAAITVNVVARGLAPDPLPAQLSMIAASADPSLGTAVTATAGATEAALAVSKVGYLTVFAVAAVGMLVGELIYLLFGRFVRPVQAGVRAPVSVREPPVTPADVQYRRNVALLIFFGINILFWMAFKQKGNTLAQWARDRTDLAAPEWLFHALHVVGLDTLMVKDGLLGKELFAALNPFYVIVFSPLLVGFWNLLRRVGLDVPTPAKLVLGFALTAGAFAIMWDVAADASPAERVTPLALVACYAVLTLGELCLSPMGLSLVSKLAAARTRAVWMGLFFVSTSIGGYLAGGLMQLIKQWEPADKFQLLTWSSGAAMLMMLAAYPVIAAALRPPPSP